MASDNTGGDKLSFNMAVDYTAKIAQYLHETKHYLRRGDLNKTIWSAKNVWITITAFLSDPEDEFIEESFNKVQIMYFNPKKKEERWKIHRELERIIRHLTKIINQKGLLIPVSDDPRFMFRKSK